VQTSRPAYAAIDYNRSARPNLASIAAQFVEEVETF